MISRFQYLPSSLIRFDLITILLRIDHRYGGKILPGRELLIGRDDAVNEVCMLTTDIPPCGTAFYEAQTYVDVPTEPFVQYAVPAYAVLGFAAIIWLTIRVINRGGRLAKCALFAVAGIPALYALSIGPVCWIGSCAETPANLTATIYQPMLYTILGNSRNGDQRESCTKILTWYCALGCKESGFWIWRDRTTHRADDRLDRHWRWEWWYVSAKPPEAP